MTAEDIRGKLKYITVARFSSSAMSIFKTGASPVVTRSLAYIENKRFYSTV